MNAAAVHPTIAGILDLIAELPAPANEKPTFATNQQGDSGYFRMLAEWEHDTLPEFQELPAPRDFAEYERQVCIEQGFGMRSIYKDPLV